MSNSPHGDVAFSDCTTGNEQSYGNFRDQTCLPDTFSGVAVPAGVHGDVRDGSDAGLMAECDSGWYLRLENA